jgi:hypothetical protein
MKWCSFKSDRHAVFFVLACAELAEILGSPWHGISKKLKLDPANLLFLQPVRNKVKHAYKINDVIYGCSDGYVEENDWIGLCGLCAGHSILVVF